jgi:hypothetical protein
LYVRGQKAVNGTAKHFIRKHDMSDYETNQDDEWSDEELLGSLGEELNNEDDGEATIWGFSLLEEEAA